MILLFYIDTVQPNPNQSESVSSYSIHILRIKLIKIIIIFNKIIYVN